MVSESVVDAVVAPAHEFIERTDADAIAADGDGFGTREWDSVINRRTDTR